MSVSKTNNINAVESTSSTTSGYNPSTTAHELVPITGKPRRKAKTTKKGTTITDAAHKIVSKYLKRRRKLAMTEIHFGQKDKILTVGTIDTTDAILQQSFPFGHTSALQRTTNSNNNDALVCMNCRVKIPKLEENRTIHTIQLHFGYRNTVRICSTCSRHFS